MTLPSPPHCFCAGTLLVTLRGEVPVETILPGDRVLTLSGEGAPLKPVIWTGRLTLDLETHPDPHAVRPIRVTAGAIEPGMPIRDLLLSPDHALALDDAIGRRVLVPAHYLVNGATILREPPTGRVTYVHVEVEAHDILMANGMAAESFYPEADRSPFETSVIPFSQAAVSPPDFSPEARHGRCAAHFLIGRDTAPLHARLLAVAQGLGHTLTDDPDLAILVGETPAKLLEQTETAYRFRLPRGRAPIRLRSRRFIPAETDPAGGDYRFLGVPLAAISHDGSPIPLNAPALAAGFLAPEAGWRWTEGDAVLDLGPRQRASTLDITIHRGWARYWLPTPR